MTDSSKTRRRSATYTLDVLASKMFPDRRFSTAPTSPIAPPVGSSPRPQLDRLARSLPDASDIVDELIARDIRLNLGGSIHDPDRPRRPTVVQRPRPNSPNSSTSTAPPSTTPSNAATDQPDNHSERYPASWDSFGSTGPHGFDRYGGGSPFGPLDHENFQRDRSGLLPAKDSSLTSLDRDFGQGRDDQGRFDDLGHPSQRIEIAEGDVGNNRGHGDGDQ